MTLKHWKIIQIVGFLALALGVVVRAGSGEYWGTGVAMLGVLVYAIGRVGAWLKSDRP